MEPETKPFFSIVTISFNQERYILRCIESVINQTFKNFEYIIQDPGSDDNSRKIIMNYRNDPRIIINFENDFSPADGLNKGFSKASGKFYYFLNSDDELCPDGLQRLYSEIINYPNYDVYSGAARIIDSKDNFLRFNYSDRMNLKRAIYGQSILVQQSTTFKSSLFHAVGGFNKNNFVCWDGELFIDFALISARFKVFRDVVSNYRLTETSITGTGNFKDKNYQEQKKIFERIYSVKPTLFFRVMHFIYRIQRKLLNIEDTMERLINGKISGRFIKK